MDERRIVWRPTMMTLLLVLLTGAAASCHGRGPSPLLRGTPASVARLGATPTAAPAGERVTFQSGDLTLVGYLFRPDGPGPFPAIIWNHGSEHVPSRAEFQGVANIFVPAGYIVFAPVRRGQGESQGEYIGDQISAASQTGGAAASDQLAVQLLEGPQLDDQLAGLAYLKSLPDVDQSRLAVAGCSFGGIQSLLGAGRGAGYRAAVALSPGAESWAGDQPVQQMLISAVDNLSIPVFLIHPEMDASVDPGYTLGQELQKQGKPYKLSIYPPFGTPQQNGHCFGGAGGDLIWGADAVRFLNRALAAQ